VGAPSTAEGVETVEQFGMPGLERCTQVQGCRFSSPRPARENAARLAEIDGIREPRERQAEPAERRPEPAGPETREARTAV